MKSDPTTVLVSQIQYKSVIFLFFAESVRLNSLSKNGGGGGVRPPNLYLECGKTPEMTLNFVTDSGGMGGATRILHGYLVKTSRQT